MKHNSIIKLIGSFSLGVVLTVVLTLTFSPQQGINTIVSSSNRGEIDSINQVYNALTKHHYFFEGDSQALIDGAIAGMIGALNDPHSTYFTMVDYAGFVQHLEETYSGIGCEVTSVNGYTIIVAPLPNSPAEEAGVLANDIVIEVDGVNVVGENLQTVTGLIKGPTGTVVTLGIQRDGNPELIYIEVTRAEIAQETVRTDIIETETGLVGYLQVTTFGENTYNEFVAAIEALEEKGIESLIIDLRNNSGGYLRAVLDMVDFLLPEGKVIASVLDRNGNAEEHMTTGKTPGKTYPIVTLINEGSASASEIFAAAMKEAGGHEVMGMTSYGKGTVQQSMNIDESSVLKLTTQVWHTSAGNWINEVGVEPTITVEAPDFYFFFQVLLEEGATLEFDQVNAAIQNAQNILNTLGYNVARTDGFFDESTVEAVSAFQRDHNIEATGIINRQTASALTMALREKIRNPQYDAQLQSAVELLAELG